MKIAVASEGEMVAQHFGHCKAFTIFDTDGEKIIRETVVPNPGHKPGFLPVFLSDKGVDVVIAGGMGQGAVDIFNEKNIKVITGASGTLHSVVTQYVHGKLSSTGSICHEHQYEGDCNK